MNPTFSPDFKARLQTEMGSRSEHNGLKARGGYVSEDALDRIFDRESIQQQLEADFGPLSDEHELRECVTFISTRAKRVYAILALIDQQKLILDLRNRTPSVDDALLFKVSEKTRNTFCTEFELHKIGAFTDEVARRFFENQWFVVPHLSSTETLDFDRKCFRFPFKSKPEHIGHGTSGQVYKVEIEEENLTFTKDFPAGTKLVYKKIRIEANAETNTQISGKAQVDFKREVQMLRDRQHFNITPLIASFTTGEECPSDAPDVLYMYLVSPRAMMDMDKWMEGQPEYIDRLRKNDHHFREHILDAMRDLISGVAHIHANVKEEAGYHGDLKPKNILLFESAYIWRICDLGSSNIKPIDETGTRRTIPTTNKWAPSEWAVGNGKGEGRIHHGRSHDVFSLGCIFVHLLIIMKHRWKPEGLEAFRGAIGDHPFRDKMTEVKKWTQVLKSTAQREQSKNDVTLVELVEAMLEPQPRRIFSWEVEVYLQWIVEPGRPLHKVIDHLREVAQEPRDIDHELKDNPLKRARRWVQKGREEFLQTLVNAGWEDEETTEEQKNARPAKRAYSTLPRLEEVLLGREDPLGRTADLKEVLVGREDLLGKITDHFRDCNSVVLYGLGGRGKTLAAHCYASRLFKENRNQHIFWVCADSTQDFEKSYRKIEIELEDIPSVSSGGKQFLERIKMRLENEFGKERWFMVVDGLDQEREAQWIIPYLPSNGGRMLFTTRNCHLVKGLVDLSKPSCIEVSDTNEETSMLIFKHYINPHYLKDEMDAKTILPHLWSAKLIKEAAEYLNGRMFDCSEMCRQIRNEDPLKVISRFSKELLEDFLKPIRTAGTPPGQDRQSVVPIKDEWRPEVQLLFLLSIFDNEKGVDFDLIRVEWDRKAWQDLEDILDMLRCCCLIRSEGTREQAIYFVVRPVQSAILAWIKENEGECGLLKRYNKALSMLFRRYDQMVRNAQEKKAKPSHRHWDSLKPHFERFVAWVKSTRKIHDDIPFTLHNRAVQAVTIFSRALLDDARHGDAISVLEFARKHFLFNDLETQDVRLMRLRYGAYFELNRLLINAYLMYMHIREPKFEWESKAKELVEILLQEAASVDDPLRWEDMTLRQWELSLDQLRVHWKIGNYEEASRALLKIREIYPFIDDETVDSSALRQFYNQAKDSAQYGKDPFLKWRQFATKAKREEGLLYLASGEDYGKAADALCKAKHAIDRYKIGPFVETDIYLAQAYSRMGGHDSLEKAISIFESELARVSKEDGEDSTRATDIKFELNSARVKTKRKDLASEAVQALRVLLDTCKEKSANDPEMILYCANLLKEAYSLTGKKKEALQLFEEFPNMEPPPRRRWFWERDWFT